MISPRSAARLAFLALVLFAGAALPLAAQDTRGSLVPDTLVALMDGSTAEVQDIDPGAVLKSFDATGKPIATTVTAVRRQHADSYILLKAGTREVQATGSHRIAAGGKFVRIDTIKSGDKVMIQGTKGLEEAVVTSVRLYPANLIAYDLTTDGHLPFLAGGVLVGD